MKRGVKVALVTSALAVAVGVGSQINPEPAADDNATTGQVTAPLPELFPDDPGVNLGHDTELTAQLRPRLDQGQDVDISHWTVHPNLRGHPVLGQVASPAGHEHVYDRIADRYFAIVASSIGMINPPNAVQTYHGYVNQFRDLGWEDVGGDGGLRLDYLDDPDDDLVVFVMLYNPQHDGRPSPRGGFVSPACEYVQIQINGYSAVDSYNGAYNEVTVVLEYHNLSAPTDEVPAWPGCETD